MEPGKEFQMHLHKAGGAKQDDVNLSVNDVHLKEWILSSILKIH